MKTVFDLKKIERIEKALRTYDDQGRLYVVNTYIPGIAFSESDRMRLWAHNKHVVNYGELIKRKKECLFTSYAIILGGKEIYRGSSIKPFSRCLVHLANIYNNPSEWGLTFADLDKSHFLLNFKVQSGSKLFNEDARRARECAEIAFYKPILMKADGTDEMIPLKDRRAAMKAAGVI